MSLRRIGSAPHSPDLIRTILVLVLGILLSASKFGLAGEERKSELEILQPGVSLTVVVEHPDLATPTGIDVDAEGRIWVVATHTHFRPDDYVGPEHDEILVFTDEDKDGTVEHRQVFYNATEATMDLELGPDGWVYLAERDRVFRIRDTDDDGKADTAEDLMVLNTKADYPHNGLEGLAWHPDGHLIFGLGENYAEPWTLTAIDGVEIKGSGEGGIFRCTADGKQLERVARGFWNPFGICVREDGEIFAAENDPGLMPPCRLLHVVEGGDYGYDRAYGGLAHHPFVAWNGELRGTLPMIHPTGEAPCGVSPIGRGLLVPTWGDHRIDYFPLRRKGASFTSKPTALVHGGRYFRPTCITNRPIINDTLQTWYLTDWVDGRYDAHGFGRVWKLQIDIERADWLGPTNPEPSTENYRVAATIRNGTPQRNDDALLKLAEEVDPFLSLTALNALSERTHSWQPSTIADWPTANRIHAVQALRLAAAPPEKWVPMFLNDESSDVQFETLRWISQHRLDTYLPDVARILKRSDIDYQLFEAAIAASNILSGNAQAGIRNEEMLLAKIKDDQSEAQVRAFALRLLPVATRSDKEGGSTSIRKLPDGLPLELLEQLLNINDEALSVEVIRTLSGDPEAAKKILRRLAIDGTLVPKLRSEAIAGLGAVAAEHTDLLLKLCNSDERTVREEALRCLRLTKMSDQQEDVLNDVLAMYPESADLVQAAIRGEAINTGRPALTDTAEWQKLLDAVPGKPDYEAGRRIFHHGKLAQCSNCHMHSGRGNVVGPDLSRIHKRNDSVWLLQSILEPSREMAPEYQPRTIILKDGRTFTGIRLVSYTHEGIRDATGLMRTFNRDEVDAIVDSQISFMPSGVINGLTTREIRDLLAFLSVESSETSQ